jgi:hypothetical protein
MAVQMLERRQSGSVKGAAKGLGKAARTIVSARS